MCTPMPAVFSRKSILSVRDVFSPLSFVDCAPVVVVVDAATEEDGLGLSVGATGLVGVVVVFVAEGGVFAFVAGGSKRSNHLRARLSNTRCVTLPPVERMASFGGTPHLVI